MPQQAAMVPWRLMNTGCLLFTDARYTLQCDSAILALFLSPKLCFFSSYDDFHAALLRSRLANVHRCKIEHDKLGSLLLRQP